jgi:TetR/AcrR family transcriptional regulator
VLLHRFSRDGNLTNQLIKAMAPLAHSNPRPTKTARLQPRRARQTKTPAKLGTRGQPEQTRSRILDAALVEFSKEGLAGARTDAIARAAGVNKALLYYYFGDKDRLYAAVLDHVFGELSHRLIDVLERNNPPREKILAYAAAHFDYIAHSPLLPRLVHREMMQAGRHASAHVARVAEQYLRPVFRRIAAVLHTGIEAGEFRRVDAVHFAISMVGVIVHYFASSAMLETMLQTDPYAPKNLAARKQAVLDFIAAALFIDNADGAKGVAAQSLQRKGRSK